MPHAAVAATTLTASTLLLAPEYRLPPLGELPSVRLAIVIDDVGYNLSRAERILALPRELTLGLLPYAPHTLEIAERAASSGRELILHQPMEPLAGAEHEPGTLELGMSSERFAAELAASLARLPQVSGVNNHTGSLLTAHREPMEWLMRGIARHGLYFLDSRTTPDSVAESTARELAVPTITRDVFLDHVQSEDFLAGEFERSIAIARRK
ncbi:MAG: divergent polysaccharide deacetylase family protein, partial [Pseudomonadales bacterium]